MADVIYRATDSLPAAKAAAAGLPAPPPPEAPADDGPPPVDIVRKHLGGPEIGIDELAHIETRKRKEDPAGERIEDLHSKPIVRMRYEGRQHGTKTLAEASKDVSAYRAVERADLLLGKSAALFD